MLIEVVLQLLIGKINAQLLKAVVQEILKPKDIQNTNGTPLHGKKKKRKKEKGFFDIKIGLHL